MSQLQVPLAPVMEAWLHSSTLRSVEDLLGNGIDTKMATNVDDDDDDDDYVAVIVVVVVAAVVIKLYNMKRLPLHTRLASNMPP